MDQDQLDELERQEDQDELEVDVEVEDADEESSEEAEEAEMEGQETESGGTGMNFMNILQLLAESRTTAGGTGTGQLSLPMSTLAQLSALFSAGDSNVRFTTVGSGMLADDDDDDDDEYVPPGRRRRFYQSGRGAPYRPTQVSEPVKAGVELLNSGEFGYLKTKSDPPQSITRNILRGEIGSSRRGYREILTRNLVPNSNGTVVASYLDNCYSGQYSADSSYYYTCVQDFRLHIYDTTKPLKPHSPSGGNRRNDHISRMEIINSIQGAPGQWTITDSHVSPDNQRMIYSSLHPTVFLTNTTDPSPSQIPLCFVDPRSEREEWVRIYSCRFSADGQEVIAGGSGRIFVYDLQANRRSVKIKAHDDDVNSCTFADQGGNILVSASDDTSLKVWDRRSLGSSPRPSGVLVGHTEGVATVASKGDGRYIISNGKDQALRLWDLRKMRSDAEYQTLQQETYSQSGFDYRYSNYRQPRYTAHPQDCSVITFRGHEVMTTLIRCHFSPAESTGSSYVYSGSADGRIHIWSIDGRLVQVLDRSQTMPISYDPSEPEPPGKKRSSRRVVVRDVSWHTSQPIMMSAGWEGSGYDSRSTIARHEWKGLSKLNGHLETWVEKHEQENSERSKRRTRSSNRLPGAFYAESDEE